MRLLVVSDTHGDRESLSDILRLLGRSVNALIHLGDGSYDVRAAASQGVPVPPLYGIRGNMDSDNSVPLIRTFDAEGRRLLLAHGHRFPLGSGVESLVYAALEQKARGFFFGHTHVPYCEERDGILILNPGSLSRPRGPWGPSFAVVEAPAGSSCLDVKLYEVDSQNGKTVLKALRL